MSALPSDTKRSSFAARLETGFVKNDLLRRRLARYTLSISLLALLLGVSSIPSIGVYIMISTLPFFVLGTALYPSRAHRWIGAVGIAGGLAGVGLLVYFLVNFA